MVTSALPQKKNDDEDWDLSSVKSTSAQISSPVNQSATSTVETDDSDWNIPDYIENYDTPSTLRKIQYGAAQETYLLGDAWRLTKSAFEAMIGPDSFEEERAETEEERIQGIESDFPEFKSGRFDNDAAVWGGRGLVMLTDPVYMLMPWSRAAQAGKLYKGWKKYTMMTGAMAGLGGTVGGTDMAIREFARTGKVTPSSVALGVGAGAVLSPAFLGLQKAGAMGLNKLFPKLFKNKQMQKEVTDVLQGIHKNKYNLNDKQLQNVYNISKDKNILKLFNDIDGQDNVFKSFIKQKQDLNAIVKGITKANKKGTTKIKFKSFKFEGKSYDVTTNAKRKALKKIIDSKMGQSLKDQARKESKLQIEIVKQLHSAGGFTSRTTRQVARMLTANLARPVFGGAGGAVYGTLFTDDDKGFWNAVRWGTAVGLTHKVLMRGGIKGVPVALQKKFGGELAKNYLSRLDRFTRIQMSMTQQGKLSQRGPILDEFSTLFFARPTDTVRLNFWGKVSKTQDDAIGLIGSGNSVEELAERRFALFADDIYQKVVAGANKDVQAEAIDIVRGFKGKTSTEAKALAKKIKNFLGDFKAYYKDVGFSEKEILSNYFPRKFNFKLIANNKNDFENDIIKIVKNLKRDKKSKYYKDKRSNKDIADEYMNSIQQTHTDPIIDFKTAKGAVEYSNTFDFKLPMSQHIELERALQGSYKDVESILKRWTVNEADKVLLDVVRTSVKSVEFARVFGKYGQGFKTFLDRLDDQYAKSGFKKLRGYYGNNADGRGPHKSDVQSMHDAVNSYFGRYGKAGSEGQKLTAAWLSTMANFSMMDKVTIANLGDLIQPFQNSRHWLSAFQGIFGGQGISRQMAQKFTQGTKQSFRDAYYSDTTGSSPFSIGNRGGSVRSMLGWANEKFFKIIGLELITNMARRYAYNVGAIDTFKTARRLSLRLQKTGGKSLSDLKDSTSLKDIEHLIKTGALKVGKDGKTILNQSDIISFGKVKDFNKAMEQSSLANLIDRVGTKTANRDAIIPTVGNRLLFTQSRNPMVRLIGQFSSWAMAKSAQTNAMLTRVESGDLRTALGMVSALTAFGAVKDLRDYVKFGEMDTFDNLEDDPQSWWSEAAMMSGNLGWLSQTMANSFMRFKGGSPIEFYPAISYASDVASGAKNATFSVFNMQEWDKATRDFYKVLPVPTLRAILDRMGVPFMTYKKDFNINQDFEKSKMLKPDMFSKGGLTKQTRKLFNKGDVVKEVSFGDAFGQARNQKQELFEWKGNQYTTRKSDETDQQYQNFLGVKLDTNVVLKEEPETPIEKESLKEILVDAPKIIPKIKPKPKLIKSKTAPDEITIESILSDLRSEALKKDPSRVFVDDLPPIEELSFSQAFAKAREELGAGQVFTWKGKDYTTTKPEDTVEETIVPKIKLKPLYSPKEIEEMSSAKKFTVMTNTTAGKFAMADVKYANTPDIFKTKEPFTEKDFKREEISYLKKLVQFAMSKNKSHISVEEEDYKLGAETWVYGSQDNRIKEDRSLTNMVKQHTGSNRVAFDMMRTLGGFNFSVDKDNNVIITDTYDFNDASGIFEMSNWKALTKFFKEGDKYALARKAMSMAGSKEGEGRKIVINLGQIENFNRGGQVRQLLNGGGSTYRRRVKKGRGPSRDRQRIKTKSSNTGGGSTAREKHIASSNKPVDTSSNQPPTEKVWDDKRKKEKTVRVDYTSDEPKGMGEVIKETVREKTKDKVGIDWNIPSKADDVGTIFRKGQSLASVGPEVSLYHSGYIPFTTGEKDVYEVGAKIGGTGWSDPSTYGEEQNLYGKGIVENKLGFTTGDINYNINKGDASGKIVQTFKEPAILDNPYVEFTPTLGLEKTPDEDTKIVGGIDISLPNDEDKKFTIGTTGDSFYAGASLSFKKGGLLDRKRS